MGVPGLYVGLIALASVLIVPRHPEVVEERSRGRAGAVGWDRRVTTALGVASMSVLTVAGLQHRWGWPPPMPTWLVALGVVLVVGGYAMVVAATAANPFFAQVVRIQTERGHVAITGGPYRLVRHPGYAGMTLSALGGALLLQSAWALLPWACYAALIAVRTTLEDRLLTEQLPGYDAYRRQTRYRLVPGLGDGAPSSRPGTRPTQVTDTDIGTLERALRGSATRAARHCVHGIGPPVDRHGRWSRLGPRPSRRSICLCRSESWSEAGVDILRLSQ